MSRVVVLGGGIGGLATAHRLAERGAEVVVLEAADRLGGLGGTFEYNGRRYERFYHTLSSADTTLLGLMQDAGLRDEIEWQKTTMGMIVGSRHYDFTGPLELLRFQPLSFFDRLRLGAVGKSMRFLGRGKDLDGMSAEEWMRPLFGDDGWEKVWRPMFTMKFGGAMVPALYLYERLARESNVALRAYPRIGYQGIADGVAASVERMGGKVLTNARVRSLELHEEHVTVTTEDQRFEAEWAVSTLPMPLLRSITTGPLAGQLELPHIEYMGVINVLYLLNRPLSGHYWSAIIDSDTDCSGMIEISTLTGTEHFQGHHAGYVMRYTDRSSPIYQEADESSNVDGPSSSAACTASPPTTSSGHSCSEPLLWSRYGHWGTTGSSRSPVSGRHPCSWQRRRRPTLVSRPGMPPRVPLRTLSRPWNGSSE